MGVKTMAVRLVFTDPGWADDEIIVQCYKERWVAQHSKTKREVTVRSRDGMLAYLKLCFMSKQPPFGYGDWKMSCEMRKEVVASCSGRSLQNSGAAMPYTDQETYISMFLHAASGGLALLERNEISVDDGAAASAKDESNETICEDLGLDDWDVDS